MDEQKAKEAAALGLGPGAVIRRVTGGGSASDVSIVDTFNFRGGGEGDPSDRASIAPSTRTSASAPAALQMAGSGAAPLPVVVSMGSSGRASQNDVSLYDIRAAPREEDGARSVFSEPPLPLSGSPEEVAAEVGEAAEEGDMPSGQDAEDVLDKHVPVSHADAPPFPIANLDADEEQQADHDDGNQGEPGEAAENAGEMVLEAEVELVAAASPRPPPRRAATWSAPRSPTARTQASPSMLCGVPVAQIVPAHDEEDEEGDDQSVRAECEDANDAPIEAASQHTHHLRFLGEDIVVATVEDVEAGNAAREPPRRRSSNFSVPSVTLTPAPSKEEQGVWGRGRRRWCMYGGAILAVVAIAVVVGIVVDQFAGAPGDAESVNGEDDADVQDKDPVPVGPPVQLAELTAVMQMLDDFLSESDSNAHRVVGSPQHRAIKWIERTSLAPGSDLDLSPYVDLAGQTPSPLPGEIEEHLIQRYALATLYYSTGGVSPDAGKSEGRPRSGWKDPSYFLTERHECQWSNSRRSAVAGARPSSGHSLGVTCDEDLRVTELNLNDNGLSGTLPNELRGLRRLRKIDMSSNPDLGGALPADLSQLSELRLLLLARNAITGTFPSSYGALANLEELNLRGNNLSGTIPPAASDMTSLTNIWLSGNGFTDGMDAFCVPEINARLFYADCFCRNFPRLEPEVECWCCTMCCTDDGSEEACNPNVSCQE
ncbi:hypothetical protein ACHAXT_009415 [Thalassiosira profunda]